MQKKCYILMTPAIPVTWENADAGCKELGAELASIESQCEQNTVVEVAKGAAWIGGNDKASEGTFTWPSGAEFYKNSAAVAGVFTKLASGFNSGSQSTQHCVQIQETDGDWDDIVCSKTQNYVCEKTAYAGAATFVQETTVLACAGTCATGWTTIGCSCYKFLNVAKTWDDATADCTTLGTAEGKTGRLVKITSSSLEMELLSLSNNQEFWTGGNDKTKQKIFVWDLDGTTFFDDGTTTGYNNWWSTATVSQPNHASGQDCVNFKVKLNSDSGTIEKTGWDDASCDNEKKFMCQYEIA